jgi:2-polyprenyl-3-methyl-5-hydroxy-6-metoxy-1,4-benzoquinol methylase
MNIFDATMKMKDYLYEGNQQLMKINGNVELTGFSPLPILFFHEKIKNIKEYQDRTVTFDRDFLFDDFKHIMRRFIKEDEDLITKIDLMPEHHDTKEYWNFIHEEFPFCDVCSYFNVTNINEYFRVKGKPYDSIIDQLGVGFFKNKKILEIGSGYGYLPKVLKENHVPHQYYCADIVKRFNNDNFIDISGYNLTNINDKFDIIIMVDVIQHLGRSIFLTYASDIRHLLKDNGKFVIGTEMATINDYYHHFFGQTYHMIGMSNIQKSMKYLGYNMESKPYVLNNKPIGTILIYKNDGNRN